MFCPNCGKEVPEGSGFCPSCGNKISVSTTGSMKDRVMSAAEKIATSAKGAGDKINEATNGKAGDFAKTAQEKAKGFGSSINRVTDGKAQAYADKAKETAQGFTSDVKQAVKDKDAGGFFKKNKYRNTKILIGIVVVFIILGSIFGSKKSGNSGGGWIGNSDVKIVRNFVEERYNGANRIDSIEYLKEKDGKDYYMVRMTSISTHNDVGALIEVENKTAKLVAGGKYSEVLDHYKDIYDR